MQLTYRMTTAKAVSSDADYLCSSTLAYFSRQNGAHTSAPHDRLQVGYPIVRVQGQSWRLGSGSNYLVTSTRYAIAMCAPRQNMHRPSTFDGTAMFLLFSSGGHIQNASSRQCSWVAGDHPHIPLLPAPAIISPTRQLSTQRPICTLMVCLCKICVAPSTETSSINSVCCSSVR
jgi:hypothetical protein